MGTAFQTPAVAAPSDYLSGHLPGHLPGHLLLITGEYPPMLGGVGAYTRAVATAMAARGWQVSVVTGAAAQNGRGAASPDGEHSDDGKHNKNHYHGPHDDAHDNVHDYDEVKIYPVISRWGWSIWRRIDQLAGQIGADWLHVQYQTAAYGMHPAINFAPWYWRKRGRRVAWTYHDLLPLYLFPKAGRPLRHWVTTFPARHAHLTIATNGGDHAQLQECARRLTRIPIGSNIQPRLLDATARRAHRAQHGYGDDNFVVGYFGFLNRGKGGLVLVEAVAQLAQQLPGVRLLMIGERVGASDPTNAAYLAEVEAALRTHQLEQRVLWTGSRSDAEVSADLNACDVLLMPYLDGASLRRGTLMAGLVHGCAIVTTTPTAPLPELADGRDLLYVPPGDAAAAAQAVLRIAQDPALAEKLQRNAQAAGSMFTWEAIAAAHEASYAAY